MTSDIHSDAKSMVLNVRSSWGVGRKSAWCVRRTLLRQGISWVAEGWAPQGCEDSRLGMLYVQQDAVGGEHDTLVDEQRVGVDRLLDGKGFKEAVAERTARESARWALGGRTHARASAWTSTCAARGMIEHLVVLLPKLWATPRTAQNARGQ
jgi:hypothetical protein